MHVLYVLSCSSLFGVSRLQLQLQYLYVWYVRIPYMHSVVFVHDAIFPRYTCRKIYIAKLGMSESQKEVVDSMYDSLIESEERRLRHRNQRDRDRRAAESAQQRETRLARWRVRDRAHRASRSAERLACETPSNNPH